MTLKDFNDLLEHQDHTCCMCQDPFITGDINALSPGLRSNHIDKAEVDHCHYKEQCLLAEGYVKKVAKRMSVRGIAHKSCNGGLGAFEKKMEDGTEQGHPNPNP